MKIMIKEMMKNGKLHLFVVVILIVVVVYWGNKVSHLQNVLTDTQEQLVEEINKKSSVDKITWDIIHHRKEVVSFNRYVESMVLAKSARVWRGRCLDIQLEMELAGMESAITCPTYWVFSEQSWKFLTNDDSYDALEIFSASNIEETREKLWL